MRKKIQPLYVYLFFFIVTLGLVFARGIKQTVKDIQQLEEPIASAIGLAPKTPELPSIDNVLEMKPIIDVSGWQLPSQIDYDLLSNNISGAIVRVQSGLKTSKDNGASDENGIDKAYQTHLKEFKARQVPVAVYAYATGDSEEMMREEARSFYKLASPYQPTYYWIDVEEKTMKDMNKGVEAFRDELEKLGVKHIGIYVGTYFMQEHSIDTSKFTSVWIPTYGSNNGYYDAAPATDIDYDLHQYTDQGRLNGSNVPLDLNLLTTLKDPNQVYQKLFGSPAE